jgi:hypothetical protein
MKWIVVLILAVAICIGIFFAGRHYGQREISAPDTVFSMREIPVPSKPVVILKPVPVYYDTTVFLSRIDSLIATSDSLRSLLTTYLEPFSGESSDSLRAGLATLHYRAIGVAFPLDRSISLALDSITFDLPETIITREVEVNQPWYEKPVWFLAGAGVALLYSGMK